MSLSNTAVPKYYGEFRDAVIRGEIPICREIEMEMHRIDDLIANPGVYYDDQAIDGFISFCENELTLTDGGEVRLWRTGETEVSMTEADTGGRAYIAMRDKKKHI